MCSKVSGVRMDFSIPTKRPIEKDHFFSNKQNFINIYTIKIISDILSLLVSNNKSKYTSVLNHGI